MCAVYCCNSCGRVVFTEDDLEEEVNLWDLKEYQAKCFVVKKIIDLESLRRYDCSLHEGWYCCKFIVMRMTVDRFGTGDSLLVYSDSVHKVAEGEQSMVTKAVQEEKQKGQIQLTQKDYDLIITSQQLRGKLLCIEFGAIWCPPCRRMDVVFSQIKEEESLKDIVFFEVDIDDEPELSQRWANLAIPFFVFFYNGIQVCIRTDSFPTVHGGLIGGLNKHNVIEICSTLKSQAARGNYQVQM